MTKSHKCSLIKIYHVYTWTQFVLYLRVTFKKLITKLWCSMVPMFDVNVMFESRLITRLAQSLF